MSSLDRRKKIINIINIKKAIKIKEIAEMLNEKENNIRRDLRILREMGLIEKVYGGAKLNNPKNIASEYFYDDINNSFEKELIAKEAFKYINNNDSIFLGAGTTIFKLAEVLFDSNINLDIVTISLPVAALLSKKDNFRLILVGGKLIKDNYSFEGPFVEDMLKHFNINKAFIGVIGFSITQGFTIPTMEQVITVRSIAKATEEINVLVDSSKFLVKSLMKLSTFEDEMIKNRIKKVITNNGVEEKYLKSLRDAGTDVILV